MATYVLSSTASDLSGGADYNGSLVTSGAATAGFSFSVAAASTETSYGFTATGVGCFNDSHITATHPALATIIRIRTRITRTISVRGCGRSRGASRIGGWSVSTARAILWPGFAQSRTMPPAPMFRAHGRSPRQAPLPRAP